MRRALLLLSPIAILALGFAGYQRLLGDSIEPSAPEVPEKTWAVRTTTIHPQSRTPILSLFGRIESSRLAHLSAAVQADVRGVRASEGTLVEDGATLVALDPRPAQLALREREAEVDDIRSRIELEIERDRQDRESLGKERELLDLVHRGLTRAEDLEARGLGTSSEVERARERFVRQELAVIARESASRGHQSRLARLRALLARAEAIRDRAALDFEHTRVRSPFRGRVSEIFVAEGDLVRAGDRLLSVFDVSRLEVRAQIPSRYLAEAGQSRGNGGYFESGGRRHAVTFNRLGGQVLPGRGGVDAFFTIDEPVGNLRIGRTVNLALELAPHPDAVWLPFEAFYGTDRVFKVQDNRLVAVRVQRVGEARDSRRRAGVLITSPNLAAGDQLVVNQIANAVEGLRVVSVSNTDP